jgi:hypothetical protein
LAHYNIFAIFVVLCLPLSCIGNSEPPASSERPVVIDILMKRSMEISDSTLAQHAAALVKTLDPDSFTVIVQTPFVVIGNDEPERVRYFAERTVQWAVDMLKKDYFASDPLDIIDIWLFRDKKSYDYNVRNRFGTVPTSPYGFFLEDQKALIMNIATGGGTLVHEIVHPFIAANFPECPVWFNEGLASLYEQCGEKDGHIVGYTNWRLEGLQQAIRTGSVPSFKTLTSLTADEFYTKDKGTNYSQARYLCYFLQEKGLLVAYYHAFYKKRGQDPTGYETLKSVLGVQDMKKLKKTWEAFVLKLSFP